MAKTPNLGLTLTTDESTRFPDWRQSINGQALQGGAKSNMEIIDEFAGQVYGVSGEATLQLNKWTGNRYTLSVEELGNKDAIFFSPVSAADKVAMEAADMVATASTGVVVFEAKYLPEANISVNFFITRGK